jgi:ABC-type nickel/cobalt efflux system permease component RcnA
MFGFDAWLAAHVGGPAMALIAAVLLGLRHATDPDHLTAVSTLVLGDRTQGTRRAGRLGLAWGLGHAATLFAFGLPVILFRSYLPETVTGVAEVLIGLVIVGLAVRLLVRWRRGTFHSHRHTHGAAEHAHPHVHELRGLEAHERQHQHPHAESLGRSPLAAFGVGLLHGAGGSAAVGVLLVGMVPGRALGVAALSLFAAATALSMALVSTAFGYALVHSATPRRLESWVPAVSIAGVVFGAWYAMAAFAALAR